MSTDTTLLQRVQDEADLCRNDGADDIAGLLDEVAVALKAASDQLMRYAFRRAALSAPDAAPVQPLAPKHTGMRVDYSGMLGQVSRQLSHTAHGFMVGELQSHLADMGQRYYAGDIAAVDEFLQLYCVARLEREAVAAARPQAEQAQGGAK